MKKRNKQLEPVQVDAELNAALRELDGWPQQQHTRGGFRARGRHITIVRDEFGRVISSVESIDEDEYEEYSDNWGK